MTQPEGQTPGEYSFIDPATAIAPVHPGGLHTEVEGQYVLKYNGRVPFVKYDHKAFEQEAGYVVIVVRGTVKAGVVETCRGRTSCVVAVACMVQRFNQVDSFGMCYRRKGEMSARAGQCGT